jgi:IS1 family transposase
MAAKGKLSQIALEKYGQRRDERTEGRRRMLRRLKRLVVENVEIKTDSNPYYAKDIKEFFPSAVHRMYKGQRGSLTGSGELKKVRFDPLFSLNHTCASIRDNVNRLVRKTWATTKRPDHLYAHLMIYANHHNLNLAKY